MAVAITDIDQCKEAANIIGTPFETSNPFEAHSRRKMPGCYLFLGYKWTVPLGSDMKVKFNTYIESTSSTLWDSHLCQRGKKHSKALSILYQFAILLVV